MKCELPPIDIDNTATWHKFSQKLCKTCDAGCCGLPVEVRVSDLIRLGAVPEFDRQEEPKHLARRLKKGGIIEHFNHKNSLFTLSRMANGDCLYLEPEVRRCTVYDLRPDTCRNHPQIGPRPGFCPYTRR